MQDHPILFSVIIPTYNRAKLLQLAIQSVLKQQYRNWELVVVDDGSTDETAKVVEQIVDSRVRYIYQENKERSAARNFGINMARGKYICFMDDDDYYLESHLQSFYHYLTQKDFPEIILRAGYFKEFDDGKRVETANFNIGKHKNPVAYAAFNMCGVWSLCIPADFLKSEKFPAGFPHWQDTHLTLRLLAKHPFHQLDIYTYIYRIHQDMGSIKLFTSGAFLNRMALNLAAISDLFDRHGNLVNEFLPKGTKNFLLAEKQLQYAIRAKNILNRKESWILFIKSLRLKVSLKFWKLYIAYFLSFLLPKILTR